MTSEKRWDVFCHVVDNLGDIGFGWRLARQLVGEHGQQVRLFLDDFRALAHLATKVQPRPVEQTVAGVRVVPWAAQQQAEPAEVVVELFGCHLTEAYTQRIAQAAPQPVWINLEHLSAESWVDLHHLRPSPQPSGAQKTFFFPGFSTSTGGLLRESDLLRRRDAWEAQPAAGRIALRTLGLPPPPEHALTVLLFSYALPRMDSWLQTLAGSDRPVALWVCPGPAMASINAWLGMHLLTGQATSRGSLTVYALPYVAQERFDELLWAADVCIVRGEDSFVRAQWAARPFIWHIYPQTDNAHARKLDAFLDRYLQGVDADLRDVVVHAWAAWNRWLDMAPAWQDWMEVMPQLRRHAHSWAQQLQQQPDLATQLIAAVDTLAAGRPAWAGPAG